MEVILEQFKGLNILDLKMSKLKVFISGQKYFGQEVLRLCRRLGIEVVGVCCPIDDKYIGHQARLFDIPLMPLGSLKHETMPKCDLGITAHSFDYIGKKTRYVPKIGWIGYHPSLLPRHRGKSSVEWTLKMKDAVTGGTVFWLNAGIDRGDIAYQKHRLVDPKLFGIGSKEGAKILWRKNLLPIGLELMEKALKDILKGTIVKKPQDNRFSTFEPSMEVKDIYRPDCLMLPEGEK